MKHYYTNCVSSSARLITPMVDNARQITYMTFMKHVDREEVKEMFESAMPLRRDWHVRYYKSKFDGKPCVFLDHSAIEYVFI